MAVRSLQILLIYFREVNTTAVIFGFCFGQGLVQTVVTFTLLDLIKNERVHDEMFITIGHAWTIPVCVFSCVSMLGVFGQVYNTCLEMSSKFQKNENLIRGKYFRRFHRSCPILRVHVGPTNFVEMQTAINLEQIVLEQTVELQLLSTS